MNRSLAIRYAASIDEGRYFEISSPDENAYASRVSDIAFRAGGFTSQDILTGRLGYVVVDDRRKLPRGSDELKEFMDGSAKELGNTNVAKITMGGTVLRGHASKMRCARLLMAGFSENEVASEMGVSVNSVKAVAKDPYYAHIRSYGTVTLADNLIKCFGENNDLINRIVERYLEEFLDESKIAESSIDKIGSALRSIVGIQDTALKLHTRLEEAKTARESLEAARQGSSGLIGEFLEVLRDSANNDSGKLSYDDIPEDSPAYDFEDEVID